MLFHRVVGSTSRLGGRRGWAVSPGIGCPAAGSAGRRLRARGAGLLHAGARRPSRRGAGRGRHRVRRAARAPAVGYHRHQPAARRFTGTVSGKTIRVPLSTNAPGIYRVDWKTVSVVNGRTITGTFQFGVGVSPAWRPRPPGPRRTGRRHGTWLIAVLRGIEYALLLLACGLALLSMLGRDLPLRLRSSRSRPRSWLAGWPW